MSVAGWLKRTLRRPLGFVLVAAATAAVLLVVICALLGHQKPNDWPGYDVLADAVPTAPRPSYNGVQISAEEYEQWVWWGEEWFRSSTFGNERVWTDVVGVLDGSVEVPDGQGGWRSEPFIKYLLQAIDSLDGEAGNLFTGNGGPDGGGYTSNLVIQFPPGARLNGGIPVPERLYSGLDVEAGSPLPIGLVAKLAAPEDRGLPYLLRPSLFSDGEGGIGEVPGDPSYRVGLTCALCHYSLDVDFDGTPDLKSAEPGVLTAGSPFLPEHAWALGNQDAHLGWVFAFASNTAALFADTGRVGARRPSDAKDWASSIRERYRTDPESIEREVDEGLILTPRGYADDTPDGLHNPLQFPSLFTFANWPFNYDGVMLNASDRNNNVWTNGLDPTQFVALCSDRGGSLAKLAFWEEKGLFSVLTAAEYAEIQVWNSPAARHDPALRAILRDDILGTSDGVPGMLRNDAIVLIKGIPGALPSEVLDHKATRLRDPGEFGEDGHLRQTMVGLLGTRVVTPPEVREAYGIREIADRYQMDGDEFVTDAVSMMLDWVQPPPNHSALLENARAAGLVQSGYEIFKEEGCHTCHAGPMLTNNTIIPLDEIATNRTRAKATEPLQTIFAPPYDPREGTAVSGGVCGFIGKLFSGGTRAGYKVVTLRHLWGSAPYLHDGGVGVAIRPGAGDAGDDLRTLLARPDSDKIHGMAQILDAYERDPATHLRADAALSLQALLLEAERAKVVEANQAAVHALPGSDRKVSFESLSIEGIGHDYWIEDDPGGSRITALVAFLLALDDRPEG